MGHLLDIPKHLDKRLFEKIDQIDTYRHNVKVVEVEHNLKVVEVEHNLEN
jgi:hypothetical protein